MSCYSANKVWIYFLEQPVKGTPQAVSHRVVSGSRLCPILEGRSLLWPQLINISLGHISTCCVLLPRLLLTVLMGITVLTQAHCPCFQNHQHFSWNYGQIPLPAKLLKCPLLRLTWVSCGGYMTFLRPWVHLISWVHIKKNMFKTRTGGSWPSQKKPRVKLVNLPY